MDYILKPIARPQETHSEASSAKARSAPLCTQAFCACQGLCPKLPYLESWLTEEVKQIPGAWGIDKDGVATVKTTIQTPKPELPLFSLSEAPP